MFINLSFGLSKLGASRPLPIWLFRLSQQTTSVTFHVSSPSSPTAAVDIKWLSFYKAIEFVEHGILVSSKATVRMMHKLHQLSLSTLGWGFFDEPPLHGGIR
jgi:hypothetical protein